jgi:uncharacterized protein
VSAVKAVLPLVFLFSMSTNLHAAPRQAVPFAAKPLPLSAVRLTGGPLKRAQDVNAKYLLSLEPDRMMAFYRTRAGLQPKAKPYGGWDGDGKNLTGHVAGHYLSAISLMFAATGNQEFKRRADYLVREMREVQDANGDGYLGAIAEGREKFNEVARGEIRSGGFDLNDLWAPWYTLHKTFAGLRDAYRFTGNAEALQIEMKFAAWAENILKNLDAAQTQKMLNTEFGGMNEVLADLYADTGDERWLSLSRRFEHEAVLAPLKRGEDQLNGLHGNTQIPKILGSLSRYISAGDKADYDAANFFWQRVAAHHSFATGGHGKDEYFGPPDELSERVDGRTAESCNIYNMLKLTRQLFALQPDIRYAEFHERALFNHVLSSLDPETSRTCYMVPVGRGVRREYQNMHEDFTCCVGSGMERHAIHGDGIFYENGDKLWVNLYAPCEAQWNSVKLKIESDFPQGQNAKITVEGDINFTLFLRRPAWAGDGFALKINGKTQKTESTPGTYIELSRRWVTGDRIEVALPQTLHLEATPDNARRVAILRGPLVLAGDLGPESEDGSVPEIPVLVTNERPVSAWLRADENQTGVWKTQGVGVPRDVKLHPFYELQRRTYSVYWDLFTADEWKAQAAQIAAERERLRSLEKVTLCFVQPGEMQPERDFNMQGEETYPERLLGRPGRLARGWFSFDLPVDDKTPLALVVTYHNGERRRRPAFEISVNGAPLTSEEIKFATPSRFFDKEYALPQELLQGKAKITVRFAAKPNCDTATVFGLRVIRR